MIANGENILREELNKSYDKDRRAVYEMLTLLQQQAEALGTLETHTFQRRLIGFIEATAGFQATFSMAQADDFRAVSQNPRFKTLREIQEEGE